MTETELCNTALGMLAHDRIITSDFRTDASTEAMRCRLFFDACRKRVLASRDWQFAEETITLSVASAAPGLWGSGSSPWLMAVPADSINVIRVHKPESEDVPSRWEPHAAGLLLCDMCPASIVYIRDVTDLSQWPQFPLDALAAELAAKLAGPLTGDAKRALAAKEDARETLAAAGLWNAKQFPQKAPPPDRIARSRR